jgi:hypothetical protein
VSLFTASSVASISSEILGLVGREGQVAREKASPSRLASSFLPFQPYLPDLP